MQSRINFNSVFQYIGRNCEFSVSCKSKIILGCKNYFSNYTYIGAHEGGVIRIGRNNFFNRGITVECLKLMEIGDNNLFGPNVIIIDHNH